MSITSFDELHEELKGTLQHQNTQFWNNILTVEIIAITLRYINSFKYCLHYKTNVFYYKQAVHML